ncbi:hypothetical protein SADUNF_Sadunf12G0095800 [Salix dunnii]|uniref:Uncharacterized protein n=1 Tax=Salix dunnii TaxID=1413687 RepID=A0A835JLF7_9ROSI|nr:hypothetical protein SADUNF_Sadunf12G0095800 [Salix dunnii]
MENHKTVKKLVVRAGPKKIFFCSSYRASEFNENAGTLLIQEVASKMNALAGDDTTSAIILASVASISAGNDEQVGNLIAETIEKVDSDVSLESSSTAVTSVIIGLKSGRSFDIISLSVIAGMDKQSIYLFGVLSLLIDKRYMPPQFIAIQEKSLVKFGKAKL